MKQLTKLLLLLALLYLAGTALIRTWAPGIASLSHRNPTHTAYMGDKTRKVTLYWRSLPQISSQVKRAVITAEDGRFFQHHGIDFFEFKESIKRNAQDMAFSRGFSTITMQLARNLYLAPNKKVSRKLKEVLIALKLEQDLNKDRILELYLNVIEWGRGVYGIEAAARHYFKKSASELNLGEACYLAAIIPSPQRYGKIPPGPYIQQRIEILQKRVQQRWGQ